MDTRQRTWNDETTEQLKPVKKSCCFCIPRRVGIIILALIKLVLSLGLFIIMFDILFLSYELSYLIWFYHIITWIAISLDVIDAIMSLAVIKSVCVKNRSAMYSICVFGAITVLCSVIAFISTLNIVALWIFLLIFFLGFMMQAYLIGLLKTEVIELESSEQLPLQ